MYEKLRPLNFCLYFSPVNPTSHHPLPPLKPPAPRPASSPIWARKIQLSQAVAQSQQDYGHDLLTIHGWLSHVLGTEQRSCVTEEFCWNRGTYKLAEQFSFSFPFSLCLTSCKYTCTYLSAQQDLSATPVRPALWQLHPSWHGSRPVAMWAT